MMIGKLFIKKRSFVACAIISCASTQGSAADDYVCVSISQHIFKTLNLSSTNEITYQTYGSRQVR